MRKQANPTIKAHLIRGAFYLLLLVAVCAIPFALAQRNTMKRSVLNPGLKPQVVSNTGTAGPQIASAVTGVAQTRGSSVREPGIAPGLQGDANSDVPFLTPTPTPSCGGPAAWQRGPAQPPARYAL